MSIIWDTDAIGKAARLKALEGRQQNVVQPMAVKPEPRMVYDPMTDSMVVDNSTFDDYGMYAGYAAGSTASLTGGVSQVHFEDGYFIFGCADSETTI